MAILYVGDIHGNLPAIIAMRPIERSENPDYSSIRRFVEALGGTLEGVVVQIEGQRYIVTPEKS